jgi:hypothetical protein
MPAVLWILAVGSFWTFAYRVYHTWRELNLANAPAARAAEAPAQSLAAAADESPADGTPSAPAGASNTDAGRAGRTRHRGEPRPSPALTKGE